MARRTATTYRASRTTTPATGGDSDKAGSAASAPESKGMSLADAMSIATAILLLAAIVMTDYYLGHRYGKGLFF